MNPCSSGVAIVVKTESPAGRSSSVPSKVTVAASLSATETVTRFARTFWASMAPIPVSVMCAGAPGRSVPPAAPLCESATCSGASSVMIDPGSPDLTSMSSSS